MWQEKPEGLKERFRAGFRTKYTISWKRVSEKLNNDRLLSFLGLCRRAGKLTIGNDAVTENINNGKAYLILLADDVSQRTEEAVRKTLSKCGSRLVIKKLPYSRDDMNAALGKFAGVMSVDDKGFAKKIIEMTGNE